jgi:hypothetical protein
VKALPASFPPLAPYRAAKLTASLDVLIALGLCRTYLFTSSLTLDGVAVVHTFLEGTSSTTPPELSPGWHLSPDTFTTVLSWKPSLFMTSLDFSESHRKLCPYLVSHRFYFSSFFFSYFN